jgi:hypothetical protein
MNPITNENILIDILQFINDKEIFTDFRLINKSIFNNNLLIQVLKRRNPKNLKREILHLSFKKNAPSSLSIFPKDLLDFSTDKTSTSAIRELLMYKDKLIYPKHLADINYYLALPENQKVYFDENLKYRPIDLSSNLQPTQSVWNLSLPYNIGWSSMGRKNEDSVEWIVFKTIDPVAIISSIKFSIRDYEIPGPCYGAKSLKFEVGFTEDNYHYESNVIKLAQDYENQIINIPHVVIGSYIRLTFYGKLVKWTVAGNDMNPNVPEKHKYYLALAAVDIYGNNLTKFHFLKTTLLDYLKHHNITDYNNFFQLTGGSYFLSQEFEKLKQFIEVNFIENQIGQDKFSDYSNILDNNVLCLLNSPNLKKLVSEISKKNEEFVNYYVLHYMGNPKLYYRYVHDLKALFCAFNNVYLITPEFDKLIGLVPYYPDRTSKMINEMGLSLSNSGIMISFEGYFNNPELEIAFFSKASFDEILKSLNRKVVYQKDMIETVLRSVAMIDPYSAACLIMRISQNNS